MDSDLQQFLEKSFSVLESKIAREAASLRSEIQSVRSDLEATETRLLSEFWK